MTRIQWSERGRVRWPVLRRERGLPHVPLLGPGRRDHHVQLEYRPDGGDNVCNGLANTSFSDTIKCA